MCTHSESTFLQETSYNLFILLDDLQGFIFNVNFVTAVTVSIS